jgi:hypothetical protein
MQFGCHPRLLHFQQLGKAGRAIFLAHDKNPSLYGLALLCVIVPNCRVLNKNILGTRRA